MNRRKLLIIVTAILLSICSISSMRFYYFEEASSISSYSLLVFTMIATLAIIVRQVPLKNNSILMAAVVFAFYTLFVEINEIVGESMINRVHIILSIFAIPTGLAIGELLGINNGSRAKSINGSFILMIIPLVISIVFYYLMPIKVPDSIFIVLLLFPLVFFLKKKYLDLLFFFIVGLLCLLSAKRSVIVVYGLISIFYVVFYYWVETRRIASQKVFSMLLMLTFILAVFFTIQNNAAIMSRVVDRFNDIEETGGSGREDMYGRLLAHYQSSSFGDKIFGHGYDAVKEQVLGISAHNDLLEVLYDYGLISALLYVYLLVRIILLAIRLIRFRMTMRFELLMTWVVLAFLLVLSMLNCIITSSIYVFVIYLELGLVIAQLKNKNSKVII